MYKKRYWSAVLYPESLPDNWRDIINLSGLPCAMSPLHDKDLDPTGTSKKEHYHIILAYDGPTTQKAVSRLICDELHQPLPQGLESVRGYYRYLTHKDNPDKYQYSDSDIVLFNGFDITNFCELSKGEVDKIQNELITFIRDSNLVEYSSFIEIVQDSFAPEYLNVAKSHTIFFNSYLRSRFHRGDTTTPPMGDM